MKDSIINKIASLVVAAALLAYLVYSLFISKDVLSYLHIIGFALVGLLVLVPLVAKVKIPNLIEVETKIQQLREDTEKELTTIKNLITNTNDIRLNPIQNQFMLLSNEDTFKKLTETFGIDSKVRKPYIEQDAQHYFLDSTRVALNFSRMIIFAIRVIQIYFQEKRPLDVKKDIVGDDHISKFESMSNAIIQGGLKYVLPESEIPKAVKAVETYQKILKLYFDVRDNNKKPPEINETTEMLAIIDDGMSNILLGIASLAGQLISFEQKMREATEYFKRGEMPPF